MPLGLFYSSILIIVGGIIAYYWIVPKYSTETLFEIGELEDISKEFHWKIKDFSLSKRKKYYSSSFTFANESWFLAIQPYDDKDERDPYVGLFLFRKLTGPPIRLQYSLSLKTSDERKDSETHYVSIWTERIGYGTPKLLSEWELLERKFELMPSGVLTIICTLKHLKLTKDANGNSQEGSFELFQNTKILQDFKELYFKKKSCDVIIRVKGQDFPAHKLILKARSPVFASIFQDGAEEKATDVLNIEDCDPSTFSIFLRFLYYADMNSLSSQNVFSLFTTAHKYGVEDLQTKCLEFIKQNLSLDTFFETITLALKQPESELINPVTEFFVHNAQYIIVTPKWQSFLIENPVQSNELLIKLITQDQN